MSNFLFQVLRRMLCCLSYLIIIHHNNLNKWIHLMYTYVAGDDGAEEMV